MKTRSTLPLLLLAACARTQRLPPATPTATRVEAVAAPATLDLRPESSIAFRVGAGRYLSNGTRAEVRDGAVSFAGDSTARPIVRAAETAAGWVFFAMDGLVAVSEGFTGPLRVIGSTPPMEAYSHPNEVRASYGRAAIVVDGALWTSDGRALTAVDVLGRRVREASFLDASFGAAVLDDGALALTRDGGARWSLVPLDGDVALDLSSEGELRVELLHRRVALRPDGTLAAATPSPAVSLPEWRAVMDALTARQGTLGRFALSGGGPDGEVWASQAGGGFRVESARWTRALTSGGHLAARWGDGFAVIVGDRQRHRLGPDGRLTMVFGPSGGQSFVPDDAQVIWSDDGRHAAWMGPCPIPATAGARRAGDVEPGEVTAEVEGEEAPAEAGDAPDDRDDAPRGPPPICLLEDGVRRWRKVTLPDLQSRGVRLALVDLHGAQGLFRNELDRQEYAVFDLDSMRRGPVRPADPSVHITALHWTRDGSLCGVGERCGDGCEDVVLRGRPEALDATPAPEAFSQVAFADARRGAALSDLSSALWRTLDAGRTWERVADELPRWVGATGRLECGAHGCALGAEMHLRGWGPLRAAPAAPLAAPPRGLRPAPTPSNEATRAPQVVPLRCEAVGPARPSPWSSRDAAPRQVWPDGVGTVAADGPRVRVAWWEAQARGAATFPVRAGSPTAMGAELRLLGPSLALTQDADTRVLWLDGRDAREVARPPSSPERRMNWVGAAQWLVVRDPTSVALQAVDANSTLWSVAYELGADGAPRARRAFLLPRDASSAIARREGRWGYVVSAADGTRFGALGGGEPVPLPPWRGTMTPCAGPTAAGATTLHALACTSGQPCVHPYDLGNPLHERLVLELTAAGACVRSVHAGLRGTQFSAPESYQDRDYVLRLDAAGGALTGFIDDGARRRAVRCAPR